MKKLKPRNIVKNATRSFKNIYIKKRSYKVRSINKKKTKQERQKKIDKEA